MIPSMQKLVNKKYCNSANQQKTFKKYIKYFMIILGINDGHNASVTLIVDGDIVIALEEENKTLKERLEALEKRLTDAGF